MGSDLLTSAGAGRMADAPCSPDTLINDTRLTGKWECSGKEKAS